MKESKFPTLKEIWQSKPSRYGTLSLIVLAILAVVGPFFPHVWSVAIIFIAIALICFTVFAVSAWMTMKAEEVSHE